MRVLHVNKFLYRRGGAEAYALDVAGLQRAAGHEVALWGMQHPDNPVLPLQDTFPSLVELEPAPDGLPARARAAARMVWSTSSQAGLAAAVDRFRPDVVHLHNIYHQLSPSVLQPLRRRGVPAVMTLHDYKLACPRYDFVDKGSVCEACLDGRFRHAVQKRCKDGSLASSALLAAESRLHRTFGAYDPVARFLCPSRFLADRMRVAGVFPDRLRVISNPVDGEAFSAQERPGSGVVFAGRLTRVKGVDLAVRAVGRLPGVVLHVAGEGPERPALEALAAQEAPGQVVFHGRLDRDALAALLRSCAVAVVPSRWEENQPLAVLEALVTGLPVVVSDLGGLPELVDDGGDGRIFASEDVGGLARALQELAGDPELAHARGRAGRRKVLERFGQQDHLRHLEQLYAEAATSAGG